jgi:hypothetical protein
VATIRIGNQGIDSLLFVDLRGRARPEACRITVQG